MYLEQPFIKVAFSLYLSTLRVLLRSELWARVNQAIKENFISHRTNVKTIYLVHLYSKTN